MNKNWIAYVVLVLAIVVAGMLGVNYPVPAPPDTPVFEIVGNTRGASIAANGFQFDPSLKKITGLTGSALTMNSGSTFTGAGTNTLTGAVTASGGATLSGGVSVSGKFIGAPSGWITLADGFTLVPTATVQLVQSAGAVGGVVGTSGATAGQILYIVNKGAQNVVVTDTATCMLSGDITLGQYDSLSLVFDGTNWIEVGQVNN